MSSMSFKHLIVLGFLALLFSLVTTTSGWTPLLWPTLLLDGAFLAYGIGLCIKLIREGRYYECEPSEFGAGLVVCLAKFSKHLWNDRATELIYWIDWIEKGAEGSPPKECRSMLVGLEVRGTPEQALSSHMEMWMNAASDHFYDLDRSKAGPYLTELADLTLKMGHGFSDQIWTGEDYKRIRELWKLASIELDQKLRTKPDWGQW